ncbi:MAG: hypothetical protein ABEJ93_00455 [Candidatus Nanohalobium sp.]
MKGQTQAVTAVLITGIVMTGIGGVYMWGVPALNKREMKQDISSTESKVHELYSAIVTTAQKGKGASSQVTIDAERVFLNDTENYIQVEKQIGVSSGQGYTWLLIEGSSFQGISIGGNDYGLKGEDQPGVIAFRSVSGPDSSELIYRIEFRDLCSRSTGELSRIDLEADGKERAAGETTIRVENTGKVIDDHVKTSGACGGLTQRVNTQVQVQFQ